jgi:hypothetical protein
MPVLHIFRGCRREDAGTAVRGARPGHLPAYPAGAGR